MYNFFIASAWFWGVLALLGVVFARRVGWEPYCRACGFCLAGQRESTKVKCPECGREFGPSGYVRGRRVRPLWRIAAAVLLLLCAIGLSVSRIESAWLQDLLPSAAVQARLTNPTDYSADSCPKALEMLQRLESGRLSESATADFVDWYVRMQQAKGVFGDGVVYQELDRLTTTKVLPDVSIGFFAQALHDQQMSQPDLPLLIPGATDVLGDLLQAPGISPENAKLIVDVAIAIGEASARAGANDDRFGLYHRHALYIEYPMGPSIFAAAQAGALSLSDLKRIVEASMTVELAPRQATEERCGDTILVEAVVNCGTLGQTSIPVASSLVLETPRTGINLAGRDGGLIARRVRPFRAWRDQPASWVTLPDVPGEVDLALVAEYRFYDPAGSLTVNHWFVTVDEEQKAKLLFVVRLPAVQRLKLVEQTAAPLEWVQDGRDTVAPEVVTRRGTSVWLDETGATAMVRFDVVCGEVGLAADIFLRADGHEFSLGWAYCAKGMMSSLTGEGRVTGLAHQQQVEIILRPARGILRTPSIDRLWGQEIVIPARVDAPYLEEINTEPEPEPEPEPETVP